MKRRAFLKATLGLLALPFIPRPPTKKPEAINLTPECGASYNPTYPLGGPHRIYKIAVKIEHARNGDFDET